MRKIATNSFSDGLVMDSNPLISPKTAYTDCLNGTLITYNGNEFTLQNDMGNAKIEKSEISPGFVPLGMKEYGGIIYLALYNPETNQCELGSIPSPSYEVNATERGDQDEIDISIDNLVKPDSEGGYTFSDYFLKLFEFEQLTLNPGDMYAIGYKVVSGTDIFKEGSLYSVEIYAVDQDNKQHKLEDPNLVELNSDKLAISNKDYKYLDKAVSSILALKVSLNNIDWFEAVCYEKNEYISFKFNWKNKLQLEGPDDDIVLKGCKIEAEGKPTFYLETSNDSRTKEKNSETFLFDPPAALEGYYKQGETIEFDVTPYNEWNYIDAMKRRLSITLGQKFTYDSSTAVYKYKYSKSNKSLRLDFTKNTINMEDAYMYVEFYDVWSDYSVIIPVDDINPAGLNTIFVDTINEPVSTDFTNSTGGTDTDLLSDFVYDKEELTTRNIYQPILSSKVRRKQLLRENNLYLVRIASIDKAQYIEDYPESYIPEPKSYDTDYKLLIINENYNDKYDRLEEIGKTTGIDFNLENLNTEYSFDIETDVDGMLNDTVKTVTDNLTCYTEKGDSKYYYQAVESDKVFNDQQYIETFTRTGSYTISSEIKEQKIPLGLAVDCKTGVEDLNNKTYITDTNDEVASRLDVSLAKNGFNMTLSTERVIKAGLTEDIKNNKEAVATYKYKMAKSSIEPTTYAKFWAWEKSKNEVPGSIRWYNSDQDAINNAYTPTNTVTVSAINNTTLSAFLKNSTASLFAGYSYLDGMSLDCSRGLRDNNESWLTYKSGDNNYRVLDNVPWALVLRYRDDEAIIVLYDNTDTALRALDDLYASKVEDKTWYIFTYNTVEYDNSSTTEAAGNIELYLSTYARVVQYNGRNNQYDRVDDLITALYDKINDVDPNRELSLSSDYFTLGDKHITSKTTIDVPSMSITAGSDTIIKNQLLKSDSDAKTQEASKYTSFEYDNLQVYSKSGDYTNQAKRFTCTIESGYPIFKYKPVDLAAGKWTRHGSDSEDAPQIDRSFFDTL